jgi:hypothetical protein
MNSTVALHSPLPASASATGSIRATVRLANA